MHFDIWFEKKSVMIVLYWIYSVWWWLIQLVIILDSFYSMRSMVIIAGLDRLWDHHWIYFAGLFLAESSNQLLICSSLSQAHFSNGRPCTYIIYVIKRCTCMSNRNLIWVFKHYYVIIILSCLHNVWSRRTFLFLYILLNILD